MNQTLQIPLEQLILYISMNYRGGSRYLQTNILNSILFLIDWTSALKYGSTLSDAAWIADERGIRIRNLEQHIAQSGAETVSHEKSLSLGCRPWLGMLSPKLSKKQKHLVDQVLTEVGSLYGPLLIQTVSSTYPNLVTNVEQGELAVSLPELASKFKEEGSWLRKMDRMTKIVAVL